MFNIELKEVHIGKAIKERLDALKMTKTEFGRLIGVPQQHVNRIFERETIETKKLIKISRALDFNFFALFCQFPTNISAYLSAVALGDGDANNNLGETAILSQLEILKVKLEEKEGTVADLRDQIGGLKDNVEQLKSNLRDKDEIITLYKERKVWTKKQNYIQQSDALLFVTRVNNMKEISTKLQTLLNAERMLRGFSHLHDSQHQIGVAQAAIEVE